MIYIEGKLNIKEKKHLGISHHVKLFYITSKSYHFNYR